MMYAWTFRIFIYRMYISITAFYTKFALDEAETQWLQSPK